jgi:hypothetical protein
MACLTVTEHLCHKWPRICSTCRKHFPVLSLPLVEQDPPTLPQHLSSSRVSSGVSVTQSLVLCVCFVDRCLFFCTFSFGHCVVCSSIYRFWLPLRYLQSSSYSNFLKLPAHKLHINLNTQYSIIMATLWDWNSFHTSWRQMMKYVSDTHTRT